MMVLICLIFSVLSTIEQYTGFANETLFWMVGCHTVVSSVLSQSTVMLLLQRPTSVLTCLLNLCVYQRDLSYHEDEPASVTYSGVVRVLGSP